MDDKYPPPVLPPEYSVAKYTFDGTFWSIVGSTGGTSWLDCADEPHYFIPSLSMSTFKAKTYNKAKAHIEALAALGEL